ncbi:MAG: ArsR transcriptional regulator [Methanoregula sp. PtaU1.Bin051]|nr:MAG: ArsR transcriptional regulator [Methanoregula sp. PtaU1.Bin051]
MPGHIRIVNDPVELVPLLMTFNDPSFKRVYEILSKSWLTEDEISSQVDSDSVAVCLKILKKGNLVEEQWRMPKRGEKPCKEYRATYNKFRANFQCNLQDLSDILYLSLSNDENLRILVDQIEGELAGGSSSINDLSRRFGVSPVFIKGLAKRIPHLDVKGQGLVRIDSGR